jgi:hypothetical protein
MDVANVTLDSNETVCDETVMALPPPTCQVILEKYENLRGISEKPNSLEIMYKMYVCIQYSVSLLQFHNIIKQFLTIMDPGGHAIRRGDDLILDLFRIYLDFM